MNVRIRQIINNVSIICEQLSNNSSSQIVCQTLTVVSSTNGRPICQTPIKRLFKKRLYNPIPSQIESLRGFYHDCLGLAAFLWLVTDMYGGEVGAVLGRTRVCVKNGTSCSAAQTTLFWVLIVWEILFPVWLGDEIWGKCSIELWGYGGQFSDSSTGKDQLMNVGRCYDGKRVRRNVRKIRDHSNSESVIEISTEMDGKRHNAVVLLYISVENWNITDGECMERKMTSSDMCSCRQRGTMLENVHFHTSRNICFFINVPKQKSKMGKKEIWLLIEIVWHGTVPQKDGNFLKNKK